MELAKGKLTSDPEHHTGEGIFFTSRAFDEFSIISRGLLFRSVNMGDIIFDINENIDGTMVTMTINRESDKNLTAIFNDFTSNEEYGFSKTILPVSLLQFEGEALMSRSQAKRLIARFEKFKEVVLDFKGINNIGQGFADELFRVFQNRYPNIKLMRINTVTNVENMILHVFKTTVIIPFPAFRSEPLCPRTVGRSIVFRPPPDLAGPVSARNNAVDVDLKDYR